MLTRASKEARLLLLPAVLILTATALSAWWAATGHPDDLTSDLPVRIGLIALFLGIPTLVATSFGGEIQHQTLVFLLSQPITRTRLWAEKHAILTLVVGILAAVEFAAVPFDPSRFSRAALLLFVLAIVCSGGFWTLVARSTVGGLAFSLAAFMLLELAAGFAVEWASGSSAHIGVLLDLPVLNGVRVVYSAVMLWLTWRTFQRFQITGASYGDLSGGRARWLLPSLLRCRPQGALANLFRVELRLHRPTFFVAALFAACWLVTLALFAAHPARIGIAEAIFMFLLTVYVLLAVVLAGAISIGEASTFGLHEWQLSLPVRARTLWLAKLTVALVLAAALVFALPAALTLLTSATLPVQRGVLRVVPTWPAAALIGLVVALGFWAATLFGDTVRAAVATGIAVLVLGFSLQMTWWVSARSDFGSGLLTALMVRLQLPPTALLPRVDVRMAIVAPVLFVALIQSYRAYRRVNVSTTTIAKNAAALLGVAVLTMFLVTAYIEAAMRVITSTPVQELRAALRAVSSASGVPNTGRRVTIDELVGTGRLSAQTRRWIEGSDISIAGPMSQRGQVRRTFFKASLTFPNGRHDTFLYFVEH
jgi:hypothetical protein